MINVPAVGAMIFDQAGTLIGCNDAFLEMTGYTRREIDSKTLNWRVMTPPEYIPPSLEQLKSLDQTGRLGPYEKEYLRSDGSRSWMIFAGASLGDGTVIEYCIDISDRKKAEAALRESEAAFRSFFETTAIGIVQSEIATQKLVLVNQKYCQMIGYSEQELLGKSFIDLTHPDDREANRTSYLNAMRQKTGAYYIEKRLIRKDGSSIWVRVSAAPLRGGNGDLIHSTAVVEDITERKHFEQTLRDSKAAAEDANRIKDEFLATLSHELRTPLGAILLWTKLLHSGAITEPAQVREALNVIRNSAEAQKELIEDLLDMSRITTGNLRLRISDVDLPPLIRDALDAIGPAAAAKNVSVKANLEGSIGIARVDPDRLRQIVWNLLTNAVKFTPSDGKVELSVRRHDDQIEIRVSDTGRGMTPEFLPQVFQRFRQADASQTRAAGGVGLGLAIVKQLVELHGGTVIAKSPGLNQGATFTVHLPQPKGMQRARRKSANALALSSAHPTKKELTGVRILLIEDDAPTRGALKLMLEQTGAQVLEAPAADPAMRLIEQSRPDLIISDIGLPDDDGYSLIRRIRARDATEKQPRTPAIALTAFARESDRQAALEAGFDLHLGKPVDPDQLLAAVREAIQPK